MTEQVTEAANGIEKVQITLEVTDAPAIRALKSWAILGGTGPVNPTFEKIFEAYWNLDRQEWEKENAPKEEPVLMAG